MRVPVRRTGTRMAFGHRVLSQHSLPAAPESFAAVARVRAGSNRVPRPGADPHLAPNGLPLASVGNGETNRLGSFQ
jgi:hypothetical protein